MKEKNNSGGIFALDVTLGVLYFLLITFLSYFSKIVPYKYSNIFLAVTLLSFIVFAITKKRKPLILGLVILPIAAIILFLLLYGSCLLGIINPFENL